MNREEAKANKQPSSDRQENYSKRFELEDEEKERKENEGKRREKRKSRDLNPE